MSNKQNENMDKEWDEVLNTPESHEFLAQKSAEMLKKFQSGELLPMDFNADEE